MARFLQLYLGSWLHLSIVVALFTSFSWMYTGGVIDLAYALWVATATYWLYNHHGIFSVRPSQWSVFFSKRWSSWLILPVVGGAVWQIYHHPTVTAPILLAVILCLGYFMRGKMLGLPWRKHFILKPLLIGLVFGLLCVVVPCLTQGYMLSQCLIISAGRIVFVVTLAIICDIGDIPEDGKSQLVTLPQKAGINETRFICVGLLIVACACELYCSHTLPITIDVQLSLGLTYLVTGILVFFTGPANSVNYFLFIIDGLMGLPAIVFWMLKMCP